jgi:hypothetical protein
MGAAAGALEQYTSMFAVQDQQATSGPLKVQPSPASIEIKSTIFVPSDALEAFERFLSDKPEYTLEVEEKKIVRDTL